MNDVSDQIAAYNEEDIYANKTSTEASKTSMEENDGQDSYRSQPVNFRSIDHSLGVL